MDTKNLLDGYVALDIETADSSNTAPCSIGYVIKKNGKTIEEKEILINPETTFSPIAMRIHKITPDMVKEAPTFADVWPEISRVLSMYPVVCHNASYDLGVLKKATLRYDLLFPSVNYYCTMKISQQNLPIQKTRLYDVCKYIGSPIENHHNSLEDARGCSRIMDYFLENNIDYASTSERITSSSAILDTIDEFEMSLLEEMKSLLQDFSLYDNNLRISKHTYLDLDYYYHCVRFGKLRKGHYILSKTEIALPSDASILSESTKAGVRYFLTVPSDVRFLNNIFLTTSIPLRTIT